MNPDAGRVVVLGASNIARNLPWVVEAARAMAPGGPLFVAHGHGRSYGATSRVLIRQLPGLTACGLWPRLQASPPGPTWALLTDIGNDLMYGFSPETVAGWVSECLGRLADHGAQLAVTELPLGNLATLGPRRFWWMRTCFFPACRLSLPEAQAAAARLNDLLRPLAQRHQAVLLPHEAAWYGLDPLHFRTSVAWHALRAWWRLGFGVALPETRPRVNWFRRAWLKTRRHETVWYCGCPAGSPQPVARFDDGGSLSLF